MIETIFQLEDDIISMIGQLNHDLENGNARGNHWRINCKAALSYKRKEIEQIKMFLRGDIDGTKIRSTLFG